MNSTPGAGAGEAAAGGETGKPAKGRKSVASKRWFWLLPLVPVLAGLVLLVFDPPIQRSLRLQLFDQYQRWQPRALTEVPVGIVDIDEASLARLGQWPWPRTVLADLVEKLTAAGAATVAFDVMFSEPDRTAPVAAARMWQLSGPLRSAVEALPDHDVRFAQAIAAGDVVLGFAVERAAARNDGAAPRLPGGKVRFITAGEVAASWLPPFTGAVAPLPLFEAAAKGNGALTFVPDRDGVVRRVPLALRIGETPVPSLVAEALRVAQGTPNIILKSAGAAAGYEEVRIGALTIPVTPQADLWVHYAAPRGAWHIPAWEVLAGKVDPARVQDRILLVGSSAQGLMDLRFSPFGLMPGVEAHAQALEQILAGDWLERPSWARGVEGLILVVGGLLAGLLALRLRAVVAAAVTALVIVLLLGGGWFAFAEGHLLLDTLTPALGILLSFLLCSVVAHLMSEREQRYIKTAFARYVSPNRVDHLIDNPQAMELGGRRQDCSFIFTDLAGFTTLMERIDPGEAVALLNDYLDEMIAIAFRHEGTLDRIVGDAVAIMFSAPVPQADHRRRAFACALEMDAYANRTSQALQARGVAFGKTRLGVHCGEVIVGNFGGRNIFDYRALGDPVNTAARLESVNKHLGTRMCVSAAILADVPGARVRPVGRLVLKGKSEALEVFEPIDDELAQTRAPAEAYAKAFDAMHAERPDAAALFAELAARYPDDPLVHLHHGRLATGECGDLIVMSEK